MFIYILIFLKVGYIYTTYAENKIKYICIIEKIFYTPNVLYYHYKIVMFWKYTCNRKVDLIKLR